ncbi:MAG: (deoxy)nucleoside triphosphate pyrophosphohydrolase, partial [Desulfuromonadales bacterium]|nr:(deoxy)nucleoside triphosphate pyrophosphohydrolase [Desulfuromonadales bacterium]NIS39626.1 (deoxy)nucleoside triphosphate pyrophosphohydrolase [Desulfuromonadales bacterium]
LALPIRVDDIFDSTYHHYDWGPVLILSYECTPLATEIRNVEVSEHRWVRPRELPHFELLPAD